MNMLPFSPTSIMTQFYRSNGTHDHWAMINKSHQIWDSIFAINLYFLAANYSLVAFCYDVLNPLLECGVFKCYVCLYITQRNWVGLDFA